jgi:hypothetical protein
MNISELAIDYHERKHNIIENAISHYMMVNNISKEELKKDGTVFKSMNGQEDYFYKTDLIISIKPLECNVGV